MAVCKRSQVVYKRHKYVNMVCEHCGDKEPAKMRLWPWAGARKARIKAKRERAAFSGDSQ